MILITKTAEKKINKLAKVRKLKANFKNQIGRNAEVNFPNCLCKRGFCSNLYSYFDL
jgi:hypothetical protein